MKNLLIFIVLVAIMVPTTVSGQLRSFKAGPRDNKYNICEGQSVTLYTYSPFFDAGPNPVMVDWLDSPITIPEDRYKLEYTYTPPRSGTYKFRVQMTDLTYKVTIRDSFNIVVVGRPVAKAGADINACVGDAVKINAIESVNGISVSWNHNGRGQLLNSTTLAPTYIPISNELGQVKLTLKVIGNATCGGEATDDVLINYSPRPIADIRTNFSNKICSNKQYPLEGVVAGHTSFIWHVQPGDRSGNLSLTNTLKPVYTPQLYETGPVFIILEAKGEGCSVYDTLQMNVSQTAVVSSSGSGVISACPGELVNMFVTTAPDFTYKWSTGSTANSIFTIVKEKAEKFSVTATNKDNCTQTVEFNVTPKSFPTAEFTVQPPSRICSNEPYKINAAAANFTSFRWFVVQKTGKGTLLNDNTLTPTYVPRKDEGGLVQIILETTGTDCKSYDTLNLNVSQMVIEPSHSEGIVNTCLGDRVNLYVVTTPGCTFLWNTGSRSNSILVFVDGKTPKYTLEVTNSDGCRQIIDFVITLKDGPTAKASLVSQQKTCSNQAIKLKGEATKNNSFRWFLVQQDRKGILTEANTLTPTYVPRKDESGMVQIVFEAIGTTCTVQDTLKLNIEQMNVELSHAGGKVTGCEGENVSLSVNPNPAFTYLWSTGVRTNSIVVKPKKESTSYSVDVTNTLNGCTEKVDFSVTSKPAPGADILTQSITGICSNQTLKINATASNYQSFKWYVYPQTGKGTLSDANTLNPTYNPRKDESGEVMVILETIGTECAVFDTIKFKISQIFTELSHTDGKVTSCAGDPVTLSVTASPNYTYLWSNGAKTNSITVKPPLGSSSYSVDIANKDGCKQTSNFAINVLERPKISFGVDTENSIITLTPPGLSKYVFLGKNKTLLQEGILNTYNYTNVAMTTDTIYFIAYNKDGCNSNLDNLYADYLIIPKLKIVDAFSPNNDGVNDRLLPGRRTQVIDRTSKILYEGWDGWDGTYLGKEMPQGTYFYLLYDEKGNIYYKGPVTLLRNNF